MGLYGLNVYELRAALGRRAAEGRAEDGSAGVLALDPSGIKDWNERYRHFEGFHFFHSREWNRVLARTYGFSSHYLAWHTEEGGTIVLPCMEAGTFLTPRRAVSLPFTDYCGFFSSKNGASFAPYLKTLAAYGRKRRWSTIELRGLELKDQPAAAEYLLHRIDLGQPLRVLDSRIRDNAKRGVRKAEREGVLVIEQNDHEGMSQYLRLHEMTRVRQGVPPQPRSFFRNILEEVIGAGKGSILLARYGGRAIAGEIFAHMGDRVVYKFSASDYRFQHLRPNNLLFWQAIHIFKERGFKELCLGRTDLDNEGLIRFKRGWGCEESRMAYHRISVRSGQCLDRNSHSGKLQNRVVRAVLKRLPRPALIRIGKLFYRHMG